MATSPQPDPTQAGGGTPDAGAAPGGSPSQAPASQEQVILAQMYQMCKRLAQGKPELSAGLQKAAQGIQEAQTALVTGAQPQPTSSNPAQ